MFRKTLVLVLLAVVSLQLAAQEVRFQAADAQPAPKPVLCPAPFSQKYSGGTGASSPVLSDFPPSTHPALAGSVWNQTATDRTFGHTFRFPAYGDCCLATSGTLTVTIKALANGSVGGSSANNDAINVYSAGQLIGTKQPWLTTGVTAGTTATASFPIPATALATGMVSFLVQDDSAVVSATLVVEGCCIRKK